MSKTKEVCNKCGYDGWAWHYISVTDDSISKLSLFRQRTETFVRRVCGACGEIFRPTSRPEP